MSVFAAALLAATTIVQAAQGPEPAPQAAPRPQRNYPPPTNLKVLPKDLTGAEVREIMHHWAGDLGQECTTCHTPYPNKVDKRGRPMLNFADDSKPDKQMARIMYTMTETIKKDYIPKVEALDTMGSPAPPVTCGTCHRGNLDPIEYVPPKREEHGHEGEPAGAQPKEN